MTTKDDSGPYQVAQGGREKVAERSGRKKRKKGLNCPQRETIHRSRGEKDINDWITGGEGHETEHRVSAAEE